MIRREAKFEKWCRLYKEDIEEITRHIRDYLVAHNLKFILERCDFEKNIYYFLYKPDHQVDVLTEELEEIYYDTFNDHIYNIHQIISSYCNDRFIPIYQEYYSDKLYSFMQHNPRIREYLLDCLENIVIDDDDNVEDY